MRHIPPSKRKQFWSNPLILGRSQNSSISKLGTLSLRKTYKYSSQGGPWTWKQSLLGSPAPNASLRSHVIMCGDFLPSHMWVSPMSSRFCPLLPSSWRCSRWPCVGTLPFSVDGRWLSGKCSFLFALRWNGPFPLALRAHLHTYVCAHGGSGYHPPIT